jgi:hypothetical protein
MLDGIPVLTYTPQALLGIAVLLVLFGLLVPRKVLLDKEKESERWRKAYEAERDARALSDAQTAELLELAKTTYELLDATLSGPSQGRHRSSPGGPYAVPMAK